LIAERVLDVPAESLFRFDRLVALAGSALAAPAGGYGGVEAYPDFEQKAAVLAWHLIKNHPMPDGNKRTAFLCLLEFVARNGRSWRIHPAHDEDSTVVIFEGIAAGRVSKEALAEWLERHLAPA
jgi:death on curing protein